MKIEVYIDTRSNNNILLLQPNGKYVPISVEIVGGMVDTCYSLAVSNSYMGAITTIGPQIGYLDVDGFHHV